MKVWEKVTGLFATKDGAMEVVSKVTRETKAASLSIICFWYIRPLHNITSSRAILEHELSWLSSIGFSNFSNKPPASSIR
jgi:hypothetical protein